MYDIFVHQRHFRTLVPLEQFLGAAKVAPYESVHLLERSPGVCHKLRHRIIAGLHYRDSQPHDAIGSRLVVELGKSCGLELIHPCQFEIRHRPVAEKIPDHRARLLRDIVKISLLEHVVGLVDKGVEIVIG